MSNQSHLACVEYPGKVENVNKMIETLGGESNISEVMSEPNRRMELRFRPRDPASKPTCGERKDSTSLLLKVTKLQNAKGETKLVPEIIGPVQTTYKFEGLCDFQFLPMVRKDRDEKTDESKYESILHKVVLDRLMTSDELMENHDDKTPLFVPPIAFSRMDIPQVSIQFFLNLDKCFLVILLLLFDTMILRTKDQICNMQQLSSASSNILMLCSSIQLILSELQLSKILFTF
jgi:general transcription factor 3C polypeptide 5 (transcription factor C subunit 1)